MKSDFLRFSRTRKLGKILSGQLGGLFRGAILAGRHLGESGAYRISKSEVELISKISQNTRENRKRPNQGEFLDIPDDNLKILTKLCQFSRFRFIIAMR